jgi:hypothetical protein
LHVGPLEIHVWALRLGELHLWTLHRRPLHLRTLDIGHARPRHTAGWSGHAAMTTTAMTDVGPGLSQLRQGRSENGDGDDDRQDVTA